MRSHPVVGRASRRSLQTPTACLIEELSLCGPGSRLSAKRQSIASGSTRQIATVCHMPAPPSRSPPAPALPPALPWHLVRTADNPVIPSHAVEAAQRDSVFCLQPWGDTATRKGFWDALLVGCIPAVFAHAGWNAIDDWFVDHRKVSVKVPIGAVEHGEGGGVLDFLRSISLARREELFRAIMRTRGRLQYAMYPCTPGGDAVDAIAAGVARDSLVTTTRKSRGCVSHTP